MIYTDDYLRQYSPVYDTTADYNTNAKSYFDYLARKNHLDRLQSDLINELIRREALFSDTNSIDFTVDGQWRGEGKKDILSIQADVKRSPATENHFLVGTETKNFVVPNAIKELDDGLYAPDFLTMIKELDRSVMNVKNEIVVSNELELQQAIDYLTDGGTVKFKQGVSFDIESVNVTHSGILFDGNNATLISKSNNKMFNIHPNVTDLTFRNLNFTSAFFTSAHNFIYGVFNKNILVDNCRFTGGYFHTNLSLVENLTVQRCESKDFYGFAYNVYGCKGLYYLFNHLYNGINYDGLKVSGTESGSEVTVNDDVYILNNRVHNCKGDGIDIATNDGKNYIIMNNECYDNEAYGIQFKIVYQTNNGLRDSIIKNNILKSNGTGGISIQSPTEMTPLENIVIEDNIISSLGNTTTGAGIRVYNGITIKVKRNVINGYQMGIRGIEASSTFIEFNDILNVRFGIQVEVQIAGKQVRNAIINQNRVTNFSSAGVNVNGLACVKSLVTENKFRNELLTAYAILDTGTDTALYANITGYSNAIPTGLGTKGDRVINTDIGTGKPMYWLCTVTSSQATWVPQDII